MSRLWSSAAKPLAGFVALVVIAGVSTVLIRIGNGDFSSAYQVRALFKDANPGLHAGSQVEEKGVQIGAVRSIVLRHGQADITLGIEPQYKISKDATATIEPQNLFGADQVAVTPPTKGSGGYLTDGGRVAHTRSLSELGQLFSSADPLLSSIDTTDLSRVVDELAQAYGGQGREIASSLKAGTDLTSLLARTTNAQLAALDAFTRFNVAIESQGPMLNHLADDGNRTLPLFNSAARSYQQLMTYLGRFGSQAAVLLADYRPQINTILDAGDNVIRVLLAQRQDVASLIQGLALYATRFGHGDSAARLPDGSRFGYFKTFILWSDVQHFVCNLIAPPKKGLAFLQPLQSAALSGNTMLNCSSELAAFQRAQQSGTGTTAPTSTTGTTSPTSSSSPGQSPLGGAAGSAGKTLVGGVYGALGQPQSSSSSSVGSYVDSLLPSP